MEITTDLVKHLANLSRLKFTETEIESFKAEFEKTLQYVDQIQNVDTSAVKAEDNSRDAKFETRKDEIKKSLENSVAVQNAPEKQGGMFAVNKMVD
jgi:aspartyl-tRNA(Asn)/glutamyl-tRNA(Gln) amidotransferase subunit C